MSGIEHNLNEIRTEIPDRVRLVAVSKNHPAEAVLVAYRAGQRHKQFTFASRRDGNVCHRAGLTVERPLEAEFF